MGSDVYTQVAFLGVVTIAWLAFEIVLVLSDRRKENDGTKGGHANSPITMAAMIVGLTAAFNLSSVTSLGFPGGRTDTPFFVGFGLMILGFAGRMWAIRTLGPSFRTTLQVHEGQRMVTHGPYRFVRHPSYAGALLLCFGLGLALQNWLSLACAVGIPLAAYVYRIDVEEKMLAGTFRSEYEEYQKRTKKLVPWVW
jgi:protein-S-isoprenylcysteine O-methyltransferase Ste14